MNAPWRRAPRGMNNSPRMRNIGKFCMETMECCCVSVYDFCIAGHECACQPRWKLIFHENWIRREKTSSQSECSFIIITPFVRLQRSQINQKWIGTHSRNKSRTWSIKHLWRDGHFPSLLQRKLTFLCLIKNLPFHEIHIVEIDFPLKWFQFQCKFPKGQVCKCLIDSWHDSNWIYGAWRDKKKTSKRVVFSTLGQTH